MDSSRRSVAGTVRSTGTARDDVRNDALRGAALAREKNVNGVGMAAFLNPVDGYRGALERKGIVPTNHAKKNITALREKQREMQQKREEEAEAATKASFKLKKFSSVESRVLSGVTPEGSDAGSVSTKQYLRKNEGVTLATMSKPPVPAVDRPVKDSSKPPVPRATDVATLAPREEKDFVRRNYQEAVLPSPRTGRRPSEGDGSPGGKRQGYGEVPRYLLERKAQAAEEEARRAAESKDDCPPGMMLMPEEERLDTLRVLQESLAETNKLISRLPLKIETMGQVKRKTELEAKLKEIEDAIEIFSKDKVYIAEDS